MTDSASGVVHELWVAMTFQLCMTGAALLFYGIYINLFVLAIVTLSRRRTAGRNVMLVASWLMAVLGTAQLILVLASCTVSLQMSQQIVESSIDPNSGPQSLTLWTMYDGLSRAQNIAWPVNNLLTDTLFLYRCYIIWGRNWKVVCVPAILILATFGIGCFLPFSPAAFPATVGFLMVAVTNVVLMMLTAGRIWWIRRDAFHVGLDKTVQGRYNTAVAIILESGALYCICVLLLAITAPMNSVSGEITFYVLVGLTSQMTNIAPTLTIVRVGLGHNIQDTIEKWAPNPTNQNTERLSQGQDKESPASSSKVLYIRPEA